YLDFFAGILTTYFHGLVLESFFGFKRFSLLSWRFLYDSNMVFLRRVVYCVMFPPNLLMSWHEFFVNIDFILLFCLFLFISFSLYLVYVGDLIVFLRDFE